MQEDHCGGYQGSTSMKKELVFFPCYISGTLPYKSSNFILLYNYYEVKLIFLLFVIVVYCFFLIPYKPINSL